MRTSGASCKALLQEIKLLLATNCESLNTDFTVSSLQSKLFDNRSQLSVSKNFDSIDLLTTKFPLTIKFYVYQLFLFVSKLFLLLMTNTLTIKFMLFAHLFFCH